MICANLYKEIAHVLNKKNWGGTMFTNLVQGIVWLLLNLTPAVFWAVIFYSSWLASSWLYQLTLSPDRNFWLKILCWVGIMTILAFYLYVLITLAKCKGWWRRKKKRKNNLPTIEEMLF